MKRALTWLVTGWLGMGALFAQTPVYQNYATLLNPAPIDAGAVENYGVLQLIDSFGTSLFNTLDTTNYFNAGQFYASPGLIFQYSPANGSGPFPAFGITNQSVIHASQHLELNATNIVNTGTLWVERAGLLKITGQNLDLSAGKLRGGDSSAASNLTEGTLFTSSGQPYYTNPNDVVSDYWGAGTQTLDLGGIAGGLSAGFSPSEKVTVSSTLGGGSGSLPVVVPAGFSCYLRTNFNFTGNNPASLAVLGVVQIVLVQTNGLNNPQVNVFFNSSSNVNNHFPSDALVEFSFTDTDETTGQQFTRYLALDDVSPWDLGAPVLSINATSPGSDQPFDFRVTRSDASSGFSPAQPITYDPNFVFMGVGNFNGTYSAQTAAIRDNAYEFTVSPINYSGAGPGYAYQNVLSDPTNSPGRVEIHADQLNLQFATVRADNYLTINATNVTDLTGVKLDAPNIDFQLLSTNASVNVPNIIPTSVARMSGTVSVWSGTWNITQKYTNAHPVWISQPGFLGTTGTIDYIYHVMVINATLTTNQPVTVENFILNNPDATVNATLSINKKFLLNGQNLTVPLTGTLTIGGNITDFTAANAPNLYNLTNFGTISVPGSATFGTDRSAPYSNVVNYGTIQASSINVASHYFLNTNFLLTTSGAMAVQADTNRFAYGSVSVGGNLDLSGNDLVATNTSLSVAGALVFNVTNRLSDLNVTNTWDVQNGFSLLIAPIKGDLLSTMLTTHGQTGLNTLHVWSAQNRGDTPSGYGNNTALSHLVINGAPGSVALFRGTNTSVPAAFTNALYVDYLEFQNSATNSDGTANTNSLYVADSLIIYFGSANVPQDKLTNAFGGRIVWASPSSVAGPLLTFRLSSTLTTNLTAKAARTLLPGNVSYTGDGIPNSDAPNPLMGFTVDSVNVVNVPPLSTVITWYALANATYYVEYRTDVANSTWQLLQTVSSPTPGEMSASDPVPNVGQRFYRVRYQRPTP